MICRRIPYHEHVAHMSLLNILLLIFIIMDPSLFLLTSLYYFIIWLSDALFG